MDIFIGIVLIVAAVFLVVAVLLQSGKDKSLSSAIGGSSSDTYYGKNKGNSRDKILNKLTTIVAIVFALLVVVSFVMQDYDEMKTSYEQFKDNMTATESTTPEATPEVTPEVTPEANPDGGEENPEGGEANPS